MVAFRETLNAIAGANQSSMGPEEVRIVREPVIRKIFQPEKKAWATLDEKGQEVIAQTSNVHLGRGGVARRARQAASI